MGAGYRHRAFGFSYHLIGALVVTIVVLMAVSMALQHYHEHRMIRNAAMALLIMTFVQIFLGILAYVSRLSSADVSFPVGFTVLSTILHVAAGALTMASSVVFAIHVRRNVRPAEPSVAAVSVTS